MSKLSRIILLILVALALAIWSPWNNWNISIPTLLGIEPPPQIGGLQVTALAGEMEVFVDGISHGKVTVDNSPLIVPAIEPGERQIRLQRQTDVAGSYWEFNRLIKFESGIDVVISYELGPTAQFSEGHVIYATKTNEAVNGVNLSLDTSVEDATVLIDGQEVGRTPLITQTLSLDSQHTLEVRKSGYESQEFKLLPDQQGDRQKIAGYNLNVIVDLFLQPITTR